MSWSGRFVESDIRVVLRAQQVKDVSLPACKAWARWYVAQVVPGWEPGRPLVQMEYERIGMCFARALDEAKAKLGMPR
jgi:hypothetical protein